MKKYLVILFCLGLLLAVAGCDDNELSVADIKQYIDVNGVDSVNWDTFDNLNHKDEGSGLIVEIYQLKDGELQLIGLTYDDKPMKIILISDDGKEILKDTD